MTFRQMTPEDLGDIIEIENTCFTADAWSEDDFLYRLNEKDGAVRFINVVAEENGEVAAYLAAVTVADEMNVDSVAVKPEHRRKGVASKIIDFAINKADASVIMLEVRESNLPAISLYQSLGFEKVGMRKDYYERPVENAILMTKSN